MAVVCNWPWYKRHATAKPTINVRDVQYTPMQYTWQNLIAARAETSEIGCSRFAQQTMQDLRENSGQGLGSSQSCQVVYGVSWASIHLSMFVMHPLSGWCPFPKALQQKSQPKYATVWAKLASSHTHRLIHQSKLTYTIHPLLSLCNKSCLCKKLCVWTTLYQAPWPQHSVETISNLKDPPHDNGNLHSAASQLSVEHINKQILNITDNLRSLHCKSDEGFRVQEILCRWTMSFVFWLVLQ